MAWHKSKRWSLLALLAGTAYPFIVYLSYDALPLWSFLLLGVGLIAARFYGYRTRINMKLLGYGFTFVVAVLALLFLKSEAIAVQAYPVIVSLSVASYFAYSLYKPPTVIERIARRINPDLTPEGVIYTRRVTWLWVAFLCSNACMSLATVLWGTLAQWMLWNGLISYLLMGTLFLSEFCYRKFKGL